MYTFTSFSTEIVSGVGELSWVDVEITCDVRSVVHLNHIESLRNVADSAGAAVDEVVCTIADSPSGRNTRTVVPLYKRTVHFAATPKCHRRKLYDCFIHRCANQRR